MYKRQIDECIEATRRLMDSDCEEPLNIGSEEMVTINQLAEIAINISQKDISINNLQGQEFIQKYGYECPIGVRGRNSDNSLYREKINWVVSDDLRSGMDRTYPWILDQIESRDLLADEKQTVAVSI